MKIITGCTRTLLPLGAAALAMLVVGCHSPSGGAFPRSTGSTTYYSTETMQKTITMVDVRSGDVFFQIDVPPGKQLTLDFQPGKGDDSVYTPDLMRYQIFDLGSQFGRLRNAMSVPNAASRRIDVSLHRMIEYAEAPPDRALRVDEDPRPDWWSPRGGELPRSTAAEMYD